MVKNKLGILCLIAALVLIFIWNMRMVLILGFLYYAYKLLYKKQAPNNIDKILVMTLFMLLLLELVLSLYFGINSLYDSLATSPTCNEVCVEKGYSFGTCATGNEENCPGDLYTGEIKDCQDCCCVYAE